MVNGLMVKNDPWGGRGGFGALSFILLLKTQEVEHLGFNNFFGPGLPQTKRCKKIDFCEFSIDPCISRVYGKFTKVNIFAPFGLWKSWNFAVVFWPAVIFFLQKLKKNRKKINYQVKKLFLSLWDL